LTSAGKRIETKLLKTQNTVEKWGLATPIRWTFSIFKTLIASQLNSEKPSLWLFDFYKLGMILVKKDKPEP
jgi:hypothetical protein